MLVTTMIGVTALVLFAVLSIIGYCDEYDSFCKKRFGASPLHPAGFFGAGIAVLVLFAGYLYYLDAVAKHQDLADPLAVLSLGAAGILITFAACIRMTNRFHGVMTALILLTLGTIAAPIIIVLLFGGADSSGEIRYVERKRLWDD